jgi:hypothetical protein
MHNNSQGQDFNFTPAMQCEVSSRTISDQRIFGKTPSILPKLSDFGQSQSNKKVDAQSAINRLSEKLPDDAQNMSSFKKFHQDS